ncbi:MAG TPA: hypothetical protein EYP22_07430 [Methanosarcinales archaeon]|nr:hypothetical protein [Methanosarcinales archaeon]
MFKAEKFIIFITIIVMGFVIGTLIASYYSSESSRIVPYNTTQNITVNIKPMCACHVSGKPFVPQAISLNQHTNGHKFCIICHGSHLHRFHIDLVECSQCHGDPPTIPNMGNGNIVCNKCHGYPDPLTPSNGNLLIIHQSRGIYCSNCHGSSAIQIHIYKKQNFNLSKSVNSEQ